MDVAQFVQQGWADHEKDAAGVLARLPEGLDLVAGPEDLPRLSGLIVHVAGQHMGRWAEGDALLADLLERVDDAEGEPLRAVWRSRAVLARCAGDARAEAEHTRKARSPDQSEASDRIRILAVTCSALLGQGRVDEAAADFEAALSLAPDDIPDDDPACRALAVSGNNIAAELEEKDERTEAETDLMVRAADASRRYWEKAGDWTNVAWAEHRVSAARLLAGDTAAARRHADLMVSLCDRHDADATLRFFAHERRALAAHAEGDADAEAASRAACERLRDEVDDDTRDWVADAWKSLQEALGDAQGGD